MYKHEDDQLELFYDERRVRREKSVCFWTGFVLGCGCIVFLGACMFYFLS